MKCTIADKVKGLKALAEQVQVLGKREKHTTEVVEAINAQIKMYEGLQRKENLGAANTFTIMDTNTVVSDRARPYFDKLPKYKKGQKTMTYAGIGSRETPQEIQMQMNAVAKKLEAAGYTLQSGGAIGADKAFEGAPQPWKKVGDKVVEWSKYAHKVTKKTVFKAADSTDTVRTIAKEIHPQGKNLTKGLDLHARNTFQVFGKNLDTPVDFVLFYAEEQSGIRPKGGTGQAVEMARRKGIPTINMAESNWKEQLDAVLEGNSSSAQIDKNTKESKEVVSVDSNQKGLEYALTNPTHTSPNGSAWEKGDKSAGKDPLTKEQREAATKMHNMLESTTDHVFVLYGEGGTGKSHTVAQVLTELTADSNVETVVVSALAHAAKDELGNKFQEALTKAKKGGLPIKKAVAVALDTIISNLKKEQTEALIVLDEMSMVPSRQLRRIVKTINDTDGMIKLIVLGDPAQLRPIKKAIKGYKLQEDSNGKYIQLGRKKVYGKVTKKDFTDLRGNAYALFIDAEGYEYRVNEHGDMVNDAPQGTRNMFFKDAEGYSNKVKHTLTVQMRQNDKDLAQAIRGFRVEGYLSYAEEQSSKYAEQLKKATEKLVAHPKVQMSSIPSALTSFLKDNAYAYKIKEGTAGIICRTTLMMNIVNKKVTSAIGKSLGKEAEVKKHGAFTGQKLRAYANMVGFSESGSPISVTNNSLATIAKLEEAVNQVAWVKLYDGHSILATLGIDNVKEAGAVLELDKLDAEIRKKISAVLLERKREDSAGMETFQYVLLHEGLLSNVHQTAKALAKGITVEYETTKGVKGKIELKEYAQDLDSKDVVDLFDNFKPTYALNTHKAQGTTFEDIIMVSPFTTGSFWGDSAVQEAEIRYVGLTRSKNHIAIYDTDTLSTADDIANYVENELTSGPKGPVKLSDDIMQTMNKNNCQG